MRRIIKYAAVAGGVILLVAAAVGFLFIPQSTNAYDTPYDTPNATNVEPAYEYDFSFVIADGDSRREVDGSFYATANGSREYRTWRTVEMRDGVVETNETWSVVLLRDDSGTVNESFVRRTWEDDEAFEAAVTAGDYDAVNPEENAVYRHVNGSAFPLIPPFAFDVITPRFTEQGTRTVEGTEYTTYKGAPSWDTSNRPARHAGDVEGTALVDENGVLWNISMTYTLYEGVESRGEVLLVDTGVVEGETGRLTLEAQRTDGVPTPCPAWTEELRQQPACRNAL